MQFSEAEVEFLPMAALVRAHSVQAQDQHFTHLIATGETCILLSQLNKYTVYAMLKFIIISVLFIYVVYKASDYVLRIVDSITGGGRVKSNQRNRNFGPEYRRQQQQKQSRRPEGDINVDYVPKDQKDKNGKSSEDFKGGEYVDYEELK